MNNYPKVNFIGNKEKLSSWICDHIPLGSKSIFDAFSGGCSISYESKKRGYKVYSNDVMNVNFHLAKALIENNTEKLELQDIESIFSGNSIKGFMYNNYSNKFFFPDECMELDLYMKNIKKIQSPYKRSLAFSLLRRSMIRKMPYSRFNIKWEKIKQLRDEAYSYEKYKRKRAYHNQTFKFHFLSNLEDYNNAIFDNGMDNLAYNKNIFDIIDRIEADVIYVDPPYSGTMNNYHKFYGLVDNYISGMIIDPFENNFIDKEKTISLFNKLFSKLKNFKYTILSYNSSSFPGKSELIKIINQYSKKIDVIEKKHNYQITGKEKKQENIEYLFIIEN